MQLSYTEVIRFTVIKSIKNTWNRLILTGAENCAPEELFALRVVNSCALIALLGSIIDIVFAVFHDYPILYILSTANLFFFALLTLFFNSKSQVNRAKLALILGFSICLSIAILVYGLGIGEEFILATILVLIWILYQNDTFTKSILFVTTIVNFIFVYFYITVYSSIILMEENKLDDILSFFGSVLIIFSLLNGYKKRQENLVKELEEQNKILNIKTRELEQFSYAASHDLKTPIRTIVSFLDLASKNDKYTEEERAQFIEYAKTGGKKMYDLVEDLALFSSINASKKETSISQLDDVLDRVEQSLEPILINKNAIIERTSFDKKILGNNKELFILFRNLIKNGILFNNSKQPKVNIKIDGHNEKGIKLEFSDNGVGIESKYFNQIFEYFRRLQNDSNVKGNGIGLSLCKKIVSNMNGSIEVESEVDKGSTFKVILPDCLVT